MTGVGVARLSLRAVVLSVLGLLVVIALVLSQLARRSDGPGPTSAPAATAVPQAPAAMPPVGSYVVSQVGASGAVSVTQWIRSPVPVERLEVTTADPDSLPGTVEASRVVVSAPDGSRLALRSAVGTQTQRVRLRAPATELYLTYTIKGDTLSSAAPTVAGRILARVTAMDVVFAGESGPVLHEIRGPGVVLNAACLAPDAGFDVAPSPCGSASADGSWRVELRGARRHDRLIAQVEGGAAARG